MEYRLGIIYKLCKAPNPATRLVFAGKLHKLLHACSSPPNPQAAITWIVLSTLDVGLGALTPYHRYSDYRQKAFLVPTNELCEACSSRGLSCHQTDRMATTESGTHHLPDGTELYTKSWIVSIALCGPLTLRSLEQNNAQLEFHSRLKHQPPSLSSSTGLAII